MCSPPLSRRWCCRSSRCCWREVALMVAFTLACRWGLRARREAAEPKLRCYHLAAASEEDAKAQVGAAHARRGGDVPGWWRGCSSRAAWRGLGHRTGTRSVGRPALRGWEGAGYQTVERTLFPLILTQTLAAGQFPPVLCNYRRSPALHSPHTCSLVSISLPAAATTAAAAAAAAAEAAAVTAATVTSVTSPPLLTRAA